jgi:hypothetical protein
VTLNKSEALFSPSTRYRDLALGPSLFHWESQEGEGGAADGDSQAAGAADSGGVDAGDGVGGLRGQPPSTPPKVRLLEECHGPRHQSQ